MQTTIEDLRRLVAILNELVQPLLEGEELTDAPYEVMKKPHIVFQEGSKTYGRAYRIHFTGGSKYGSGHCEPRFFSDYLGMTKAEAERSLRSLIGGLRAGIEIGKANK